MFSDPLVVSTDYTTVTVNASGNMSLPCVERGPNQSKYQEVQSNGDVWDVTIGHQYGKRGRYTVRVTVSGIRADLINDNLNSRFSQSMYCVVDLPITGEVYVSAPLDVLSQMSNIIGTFLVSTSDTMPVVRVVHGET